MLQEENLWAYPIVDDLPVLITPERLVPPGLDICTTPQAARYQEASEEAHFYNAEAERDADAMSEEKLPPDLAAALRATEADRAGFPEPRDLWIDAVFDSASEWDAYRHIAPLTGKRILQLGGKGTHASKFLLAGAAECWLLSPMIGELAFSVALARRCGVAERFHCAGGIAEEIPFEDGSFDAIYSGGCVHHMVTDRAFAECARVLRSGGRFAAVEPWRAPLYSIGTRLLGKREVDVNCRPLTRERVGPLSSCFRHAEVIHHGALSRYAFLAFSKLGLQPGLPIVWNVTRLDDALCTPIPWVRRAGSSVSLLASKI